jgi:UPF0271 protein
MTPAEIARMVAAQVGALQGVAALAGAVVRYVKPHGALANLAADDAAVAAAIAGAVAQLPGHLAVLAISGTALEDAARAAGLVVYSEVFADRAYLANGRLMPRARPGAVLHDPEVVVARMLAFLDSGLMPVAEGGAIPLAAQSICVHGDNPQAVAVARLLRDRTLAAGIALRPFVA